VRLALPAPRAIPTMVTTEQTQKALRRRATDLGTIAQLMTRAV